uniref:Uncharacterized protein n=1 Tax=Panagrolaimus superbus TaxID=310955 RepID=A0A914YV10_9BILA
MSPLSESMTEHFVAKPHIHAEVSTVPISERVRFPSSTWKNDEVHIPREALEFSGGFNGQVLYSNYDGFQRYLQPLKNPEHQYQKVLASKILTVSIVRNGQPYPTHRIPRPVVLSFHTQVSPNLTNPQCVWWDNMTNDWNGNGCTMKSYNGSITTCECSHLTHFAILMDVRGIQLPVFQEMLLTVFTYVGCLLSIICLILSFLAFFIFGDHSNDRNAIHMNLSFTLAIAEIVFLLGIYRTNEKLLCTIVAAVLQYFFLSAFCWMALEDLESHVIIYLHMDFQQLFLEFHFI